MYSIVFPKCFENRSDILKKKGNFSAKLKILQHLKPYCYGKTNFQIGKSRCGHFKPPPKTILSKIKYTKQSTFVTNTQTFW